MKIHRPGCRLEDDIVDVMKIEVPDLWHLARSLKKDGRHDTSRAVLQCWHLTHDLLGALRNIAKGADIKKPVPTTGRS